MEKKYSSEYNRRNTCQKRPKSVGETHLGSDPDALFLGLGRLYLSKIPNKCSNRPVPSVSIIITINTGC